MQGGHELKSPYKTAKEAAVYIRKGLSTFRGYVKRYKIPRYGPAGDLYLVSDLEEFMANSACFLGHTPPRRCRDKTFTPVKV